MQTQSIDSHIISYTISSQGFVFQTNNGVLSFLIKGEPRCCEEFICRSSGITEPLVDKKISSVQYNIPKSDFPAELYSLWEKIDPTERKRMHNLFILLQMESGEKIYIMLSNYQEGDYAHHTLIEWQGKEIYSTWL